MWWGLSSQRHVPGGCIESWSISFCGQRTAGTLSLDWPAEDMRDANHSERANTANQWSQMRDSDISVSVRWQKMRDYIYISWIIGWQRRKAGRVSWIVHPAWCPAFPWTTPRWQSVHPGLSPLALSQTPPVHTSQPSCRCKAIESYHLHTSLLCCCNAICSNATYTHHSHCATVMPYWVMPPTHITATVMPYTVMPPPHITAIVPL